VSDEQQETDPFSSLRTARALAIEEYAKLESALSGLLAHLLETTQAKASIVFYSLLNSRARNLMFQSLITARHGDKYDIHWFGQPGERGARRIPGLFVLIDQLNEERNRIVHWQIVRSADQISAQLMMPEFWLRDPTNPSPRIIDVPELGAFIQKVSFVSGSIQMFVAFNTQAVARSRISVTVWFPTPSSSSGGT
jgi:hypothetical protein